MRFFTQYMEHFPNPAATAAQRLAIEKRVNKIMALKKSDPSADVSSLEREIDELVYKLYGLAPSEIALVEEATARAQSQ